MIFPRLEAKKRVQNVEGRTRLIVQLDTPQTYSDFTAQFARYKEQAGNVQIGLSLMLEQLARPKDSDIRKRAWEEPKLTGKQLKRELYIVGFLIPDTYGDSYYERAAERINQLAEDSDVSNESLADA